MDLSSNVLYKRTRIALVHHPVISGNLCMYALDVLPHRVDGAFLGRGADEKVLPMGAQFPLFVLVQGIQSIIQRSRR